MDRTEDRHLEGEIQLVAPEGTGWKGAEDGECQGRSQWSHLEPGGTVTITDQAGDVLVDAPITTTIGTGRSCRIFFAADLPDSDVYRVEVSADDAVTWSAEELDDLRWKVVINRPFVKPSITIKMMLK